MIRDYHEAVKAEINKREANKSETGLEWACDAFLQSELNRIRSEASKPTVIHTVDTIQVEPEDYVWVSAYALAGTVFGGIALTLCLLMVFGMI